MRERGTPALNGLEHHGEDLDAGDVYRYLFPICTAIALVADQPAYDDEAHRHEQHAEHGSRRACRP